MKFQPESSATRKLVTSRCDIRYNRNRVYLCIRSYEVGFSVVFRWTVKPGAFEILYFIRPTIWTPRHANDAKSTGARIEPDCRRPTGECNYAIGSRGTVQRRRRNLDIARYLIGTYIIIIYSTVWATSFCLDKTSENTSNRTPRNDYRSRYVCYDPIDV